MCVERRRFWLLVSLVVTTRRRLEWQWVGAGEEASWWGDGAHWAAGQEGKDMCSRRETPIMTIKDDEAETMCLSHTIPRCVSGPGSCCGAHGEGNPASVLPQQQQCRPAVIMTGHDQGEGHILHALKQVLAVLHARC